MGRIINKIVHIYQLYKWYFYVAEELSIENTKKRLMQYYSADAPSIGTITKPCIVVMIDGRYTHGGLTDRMRGILATYKWAKNRGYEFKINWVFPYRLEQYLKPNKISWQIMPCELSYNTSEALPICIYDYGQPFQYRIFNRLMDKFVDDTKKQYHVYSNINGVEHEFRKLFDELFTPSEDIQKEIKKHIDNLGGNYVSFTFRFQELLGDFKEQGKWVTLKDNEKETLIKKCIEIVDEVYVTSKLKGRILITSDSSLFLKEIAEELDYVYVLSGKISHMDFQSGETDYRVHMRSFIDFFLLAKAKTSYLVCCDKMYKSNFAKYAAFYGKHKYFEIIRR